MWQFCFKWRNVVMSTGVGMTLLDPRVQMGISYYWGEKNHTMTEQMNEGVKTVVDFNHLMILAILMINFPCNLRFNKYKHTHTQKIDIWQETVTVVQLLHSNFAIDQIQVSSGCWISFQSAQPVTLILRFGLFLKSPSFALFAHGRHLSCSLCWF